MGASSEGDLLRIEASYRTALSSASSSSLGEFRAILRVVASSLQKPTKRLPDRDLRERRISDVTDGEQPSIQPSLSSPSPTTGRSRKTFAAGRCILWLVAGETMVQYPCRLPATPLREG